MFHLPKIIHFRIVFFLLDCSEIREKRNVNISQHKFVSVECQAARRPECWNCPLGWYRKADILCVNVFALEIKTKDAIPNQSHKRYYHPWHRYDKKHVVYIHVIIKVWTTGKKQHVCNIISGRILPNMDQQPHTSHPETFWKLKWESDSLNCKTWRTRNKLQY